MGTTILFFCAMILCGVVHGLINCSHQSKIFMRNRPVLEILALFLLLATIYWLLMIAEKDIWQSYFGALAFLITFAIALFTGDKLFKK